MDPTATHRAMTDCLNNNDYHKAFEHADNLDTWVSNGGFFPEHLNRQQFYNTFKTLTRLDKVSAQLFNMQTERYSV